MQTDWSFWLRLGGAIILALIVRQAVLRYGKKFMGNRGQPGSKGPRRPNSSNRTNKNGSRR